MTLAERFELVEYIESTVESARIEVNDQQKAMIRSRSAQLRSWRSHVPNLPSAPTGVPIAALRAFVCLHL